MLSLPVMNSCSDDDMPPSAVDDKIWDLDGKKDQSYSPGDNFFMYCNGEWWNNTDLGDQMMVSFWMIRPSVYGKKTSRNRVSRNSMNK